MFYKFIPSLIKIFLFLFLTKNTHSSDAELKLRGEYLHQFQEYKHGLFQTKLMACISLIGESIKSQEGNIHLHRAIKNTKLNREKFYDKYTIALITQCVNNINEGQLEYLIIPENIENYNLNNNTLLNLLKLDYEINTLELTYEENEIKKIIDEVYKKNDVNKVKKKKSFLDFFDKTFILKCLTIAGPILFFLFHQSFKMLKKEGNKELDPATKEMLELIKARGKKSPNYKETTTNEEKKKDEKEKKD